MATSNFTTSTVVLLSNRRASADSFVLSASSLRVSARSLSSSSTVFVPIRFHRLPPCGFPPQNGLSRRGARSPAGGDGPCGPGTPCLRKDMAHADGLVRQRHASNEHGVAPSVSTSRECTPTPTNAQTEVQRGSTTTPLAFTTPFRWIAAPRRYRRGSGAVGSGSCRAPAYATGTPGAGVGELSCCGRSELPWYARTHGAAAAQCPRRQFALPSNAAAAARRFQRWPRARFRRDAFVTVAVVPHGREMSPAPPLFSLAPRLGSLDTSGVSRVPARSRKRTRAAAAWPFSWIKPPSESMWPAVPCGASSRASPLRRCGTVAPLRRPRRLQPTTLLSQPVDAATIAPRHEDRTKKVLSKMLAASGLEADFAACHYPFCARRHHSHRRFVG